MQSSSSRISTLVKQARLTFSSLIICNENQQEQIESLKRAMNKISKSDLNFNIFDSVKSNPTMNSIDRINHEKFRNSNAPVFYMKLYEDEIISVGIFVIKSNHRIPLHDHPHMFGLIKVLDGQGYLNAYNVLLEKNKNELICAKHTSTIITAQSETAVLYPNQSNIHEIYAVNDQHCAFLDILSPPYSDENDCTCYVALPLSSTSPVTALNNDKIDHERDFILKRVFDDEYYTESLEYTGPAISSS